MPTRTDATLEELADARRALALAEADLTELLDLRAAVAELRAAVDAAGGEHAERAYALAARLTEVEVERDALRARLGAVEADRDDAARAVAARDAELARWRVRTAGNLLRRAAARAKRSLAP